MKSQLIAAAVGAGAQLALESPYVAENPTISENRILLPIGLALVGYFVRGKSQAASLALFTAAGMMAGDYAAEMVFAPPAEPDPQPEAAAVYGGYMPQSYYDAGSVSFASTPDVGGLLGQAPDAGTVYGGGSGAVYRKPARLMINGA